jgi:hypothetical protein
MLRAGRRRRTHAMWAGVLTLVLAAAACTYSQQEPGIFPPAARDSAALPDPPPAPQPTNPALPVLGETVWTTGEGLQVTLRFAIHALRRIKGATILDWSVTPLPSAGLARGDDVPMWVDLGLTGQSADTLNLFLVDPAAGTVYRPLSHKRRELLNHCLCTPLWAVQLDLRISETRLLQTAFPELPASTAYVDVDLTNSAPFWHVPVIPAGQLNISTQPTDLARPPDVGAGPLGRLVFDSGPPGDRRLQSITINRIERSPDFTSLSWTLRSITDQPEFWLVPYRPPIAAVLPASVHDLGLAATNGPELVVPGSRQPLQARWMSASTEPPGYYECICTSLGLWAASLRRAGGAAEIVTNFPALPAGVTSVDVVLPGAGVIPGLPVVAAADSATRLQDTAPSTVGRWTYVPGNPPRGWTTDDWPTPLPDPSVLPDYRSVVEKLVTLPPSASQATGPASR